MSDKIAYFTRSGDGPWVEVTRRGYINAERAAGFRPKGSSWDPGYDDRTATGSFGSGSSSGMQVYQVKGIWPTLPASPDFPVVSPDHVPLEERQ